MTKRFVMKQQSPIFEVDSNPIEENERIKKVLNTHLNKSYVELNKFKSLKNPSNPERVRKQIIIRDAEIMLLIRILKEIDGLKSVYEENEQLKQQINELQFNKALGQQEYQKRLFE